MDIFGVLGSLLNRLGEMLPRWVLIRSTEGAVVFTRKGEKIMRGPRIVWYLPCVSDMDHCTVVRQAGSTGALTLMTRDNQSVIADAVVAYTVVDLKAYLVDNMDADVAIGEVMSYALRNAITGHTVTEIQSERGRDGIDAELTNYAQEALGQFGVKVEYMRLTEFSRAKILNHVGVPAAL